MPIQKRWTKFTYYNITKTSEEPGAYEIANRYGKIIYTGGSNVSVRSRLMNHFRNNKFSTASYFRYEVAGLFESGIDLEAYHFSKYQNTHNRKPRYTVRSPRLYDYFSEI